MSEFEGDGHRIALNAETVADRTNLPIELPERN
jgi:hypothetical protein